MTWRNPVKILKGAHKLMVGEFFSFSKVYFMCYVYFQKEFLYKLILLSFNVLKVHCTKTEAQSIQPKFLEILVQN